MRTRSTFLTMTLALFASTSSVSAEPLGYVERIENNQRISVINGREVVVTDLENDRVIESWTLNREVTAVIPVASEDSLLLRYDDGSFGEINLTRPRASALRLGAGNFFPLKLAHVSQSNLVGILSGDLSFRVVDLNTDRVVVEEGYVDYDNPSVIFLQDFGGSDDDACIESSTGKRVSCASSGAVERLRELVADRVPQPPPPPPVSASIDPRSANDELGFPWPPPPQSAKFTIESDALAAMMASDPLASLRAPTFSDLDRILSAALNNADYREPVYFRGPPEGYVMVTALEKIDDDGLPLEPRWGLGPANRDGFSLGDLFAALFSAQEGRYRVIAFALAYDVTPDASLAVPTGAEAEAWFKAGSLALPSDLRARPLVLDAGEGQRHRIFVLVYEFEKPNKTDPAVVVASNWGGRQHLDRAGILEHLP